LYKKFVFVADGWWIVFIWRDGDERDDEPVDECEYERCVRLAGGGDSERERDDERCERWLFEFVVGR
jgi:hypothetical protein